MSMKNSDDNIGNRTRDLLACSAMPQRTAPPRTPFIYIYTYIKRFTTIVSSQKQLLLWAALSYISGHKRMSFVKGE